MLSYRFGLPRACVALAVGGAVLLALSVPPAAAASAGSHHTRPQPRHFTVAEQRAQSLRGLLTSGVRPTTRLVLRTMSRRALRTAVTYLHARGVEVGSVIPALHAVSVDVPAERARSMQRDLARQPGATQVTQAHIRSLSYVPNDPSWSNEALYLDDVDAPAA